LAHCRLGSYGNAIRPLRSIGIRDPTNVATLPRGKYGCAERLIGSIRRESLTMLVCSESGTCHVLLSYLKYYSEVRTHLPLENDAPASRAADSCASRGPQGFLPFPGIIAFFAFVGVPLILRPLPSEPIDIAKLGWTHPECGRTQIGWKKMPAIVKKRRRGRMTLAALARRKIQQFGPYKSLALLFVPLVIVEPLKIAGVAFAGLGHWAGGACMIVGAYAAGFLFVDRLFRVVKSKLLTIKWFAALAARWDGACNKAGEWIRGTGTS